MRTWFNALPSRHHAGAASLGWLASKTAHHAKSAFRCRKAGSPYALAN